MRRKKVFNSSRRLRNIIEKEGWSLYLLNREVSQDNQFADMEQRGPERRRYSFGSVYQFLPIPKTGESLEDSFARMNAQKLSPAFDINGDSVNIDYIDFREEMSIIGCLHPIRLIGVSYENLLDKFKRDFFTWSPYRMNKNNNRIN